MKTAIVNKRFFQANSPDIDFPGESAAAINDLLFMGLDKLRRRTRWLMQNDDYCKRFSRLMVQNIVGHEGIRLKSMFKKRNGEPHSSLNEKIDRAWRIFAKPKNFSMNGRDSYVGSLSIAVRQFCSDGEFLARVVKTGDRKHPVKMQMLDNQIMPTNYTLKTNVKNGVEIDEYSKALAYHVFSKNPFETSCGLSSAKIIRIAADDVFHGFISDNPNQLRGIPPIVSAIKRLRILGGYEDAELVAARLGAIASALLESNVEQPFDGENDITIDDIELEPGSLIELPFGKKLSTFKPEHPTTAFEPFIKAILRGIASGMNISYNSLTSDLEGVSYSSIRAGTLSERDYYKLMQAFFINTFCRPLVERWISFNLDFGYLSDILTTAQKRIVQGQFEDPSSLKFYPRGWDWVDPLKDIKAEIEALNAGLTSKSRIAAKTGKDIKEINEELALERMIENEQKAE